VISTDQQCSNEYRHDSSARLLGNDLRTPHRYARHPLRRRHWLKLPKTGPQTLQAFSRSRFL